MEAPTQLKITHRQKKQSVVTHTESKGSLLVDGDGSADSFLATDLLAASLGSCVIAVLRVAARKHNLDLNGISADVLKHQTGIHLSKIELKIKFPHFIADPMRKRIENAAKFCPVKKALNPELDISFQFIYLEPKD